jgi:putative ABC transport system substrate-binding protein
MRRREFITLLGGAAAVGWPKARAQQGERIRRVGILMPLAAGDPVGQTRITAFVQALAHLAWIDSRNVRIDVRWSAGSTADTRKYAAELVALAPDVIQTTGSATVPPLLQAAGTISNRIRARSRSGGRRLRR